MTTRTRAWTILPSWDRRPPVLEAELVNGGQTPHVFRAEMVEAEEGLVKRLEEVETDLAARVHQETAVKVERARRVSRRVQCILVVSLIIGAGVDMWYRYEPYIDRDIVSTVTRCFRSNPELHDAVRLYSLPETRGWTRPYGYRIGEWCVGRDTDMTGLFESQVWFNEPIQDWDVSRVTSMASMFRHASNFNQDISSWDVSSVTDMEFMFVNATAFNHSICPWKRKASSKPASHGTPCSLQESDWCHSCF